MEPALLADLLAGIHVAFLVFVVGGFLAIPIGAWRGWRWVRRPGFRLPHVACAVLVAVEAAVGWICPLTAWERLLRGHAGQADEDVSFVGRLLRSILFVDVPQAALNVAHVLFGLLVLAALVLVPLRRRG
ncbi:MAG: DUF2784 domain-containing protein [Planctomycetota bacterium]